MPQDKNLDFVAIDEIQMCDHERGHIFTDRLLNLRGEKLTMFLGSNTNKNIIQKLRLKILNLLIKKGIQNYLIVA